jgi:hypothetical protein
MSLQFCIYRFVLDLRKIGGQGQSLYPENIESIDKE